MVNCLHPKWTAQQVDKIAKWAGRQSLPVIAAGTYYFQHNLGPEPLRCEGQAGLSSLLADGVFQWVRPEELVRTYDSPFNTIEDFLFIANAAGTMYGQSRIVVGPDDFTRGQPTGAHRPVRATFTILDDTPEARLRRQIVDQALKVRPNSIDWRPSCVRCPSDQAVSRRCAAVAGTVCDYILWGMRIPLTGETAPGKTMSLRGEQRRSNLNPGGGECFATLAMT